MNIIFFNRFYEHHFLIVFMNIIFFNRFYEHRLRTLYF